MVLATIQRLSDDILLVVFDFLDAKSLKNVSLVCFNWSELIGSSTTTMKKFKLILSNRRLPSQKDKLKWKHRNIEISYGLDQDSINEYFNKFLENFTDNVDTLMVNNLMFTSITNIAFSLILRLLLQCPNLILFQMLTMRDFNVNEEPKLKSVSLSKLKILKIHWNGKQNFFLKFLKAEQVLEVTLEKSSGIRDDDLCNVIPTFVKSLKNLKRLRTSTYSLDRMIELLPEYGLQLKTLDISPRIISTSTMKKLNKFLISQSSSLTELKFLSCWNYLLSLEILRTISRLKCLSKLALVVAPAYSTDISHLRSLEPMTTLSELKMKYYEYDIGTTSGKYLISKCPNLKRLKLECSNYAREQIWSWSLCSFTSSIQHISVHCPKLEVLSICFVRGLIDSENFFVHLKHLRVYSILNISDWIALINSSPSIESLIVKRVTEVQVIDNIFSDLLEKPTLSHLVLRIKHAPEAGDIFRNKNYMNSQGKLKTLQLNFENMEDLLMFELSMNWSKWCIEEQSITKIQVMKHHRIGGNLTNLTGLIFNDKRYVD